MKPNNRPFWPLVILFALCACTTSTPSVTTTTPFNLVLPTPLNSDIREPNTPAPQPTTAVFPTPIPMSWQTYRDPQHNIGFAIPSHWQQTHHANSLTIANDQPSQNCYTQQPSIELTFTSFALAATEATTNWLYTHLSSSNRTIVAVEQGYTGNYPSLFASANHENDPTLSYELIIRLTPELILLITLGTPESRFLPDVQAIFASLAAPNQSITLPAAPPDKPATLCE